jgi:hypothetical protein
VHVTPSATSKSLLALRRFVSKRHRDWKVSAMVQ